MYHTQVQGSFPPLDPTILVVAGSYREYVDWEKVYRPVAVKTVYVRNPDTIIGWHNVDVIFIANWNKRKDIGQILYELSWHLKSRIDFWDKKPLDAGCIIFPFGSCYFPKEKLDFSVLCKMPPQPPW